jgi:choline dehydrogenase-like flavoprotein
MIASSIFDCAIIGAGPAGITIARKLSQAGMKVALIEGGGRLPTESSQRLYEGTATALPYDIEMSRLRYFGGTSGHWTGMCRPLDQEDYDRRPDIGRGPWPFDRSELEPFSTEAYDILDLEPSPVWQPQSFERDVDDLGAQQRAGLAEIFWAWSPPTRFNAKYFQEISATANIRLLMNTSVIGFTPDPSDASKVQLAQCRDTETGEDLAVSARTFVLSCGGIENPRILLFSNARYGTAFGNAAGLLGTCFMEHPHVKVGSFVGFKHFINPPGNKAHIRYFKTTPTFQRQHAVLNSAIRMYYGEPFDLGDFQQWNFQLPEPVTGGELYVVSEQQSSSLNSVSLMSSRDRLGVPKAQLQFALSELDLRTIMHSTQAIASYLIYSDLGRAKIDISLPIKPGDRSHYGRHHMGTTRMGSSDRTGVVDPDCRVYGTHNLFVAGSSLFPTSGYANPTLTIVLMALRLAAHLVTRERQ